MSSPERDNGGKVKRLEQRVDDHEQTHEAFDRRITRNENWRLRAQGALQMLAILLGTGIIAVVLELGLNLI